MKDLVMPVASTTVLPIQGGHFWWLLAHGLDLDSVPPSTGTSPSLDPNGSSVVSHLFTVLELFLCIDMIFSWLIFLILLLIYLSVLIFTFGCLFVLQENL